MSCSSAATGIGSDPVEMVDRGRHPLQVKESWFFDGEEGELLLQYFRDPHLGTWNDFKVDGRISTLLKLIDDRYPQTTPDGKHIDQEGWREDRIGLYDTLLRIILGAEYRNWEDWRGEVSTFEDRWNKEFEGKFTKRDNIYKRLLDYIHEHDDVKLEVYTPEFKEKNFCFFRSMERYWIVRSEKLWFLDTEKGKLLIDQFRESPHSHTWTDAERDVRIRDLLKFIDAKYIVDMETNIQAGPKKMAPERKRIRKEWRVARINLYNNLFLILRGAKRPKEFGDELTKSGSIYKHLLDYIHEHDDVMLKFYHAKRTNILHKDALESNEMYYGFCEAMTIYRVRHINPTADIIFEWMENKTDWEEGLKDAKKICEIPVLVAATEEFNKALEAAATKVSNEVNAATKEINVGKLMESATKKFNIEVLKAATQEFKTMIESSGKKSWRYKARMYWLLSRLQHAPKGTNIKFKSSDCVGPVGVVWPKMIKQDNWVLLDEDANFANDDKKFEGFADKDRYGTKRGTLDYSSLLAYACAKKDHGLVSRMLESKKEFEADAECDYRWEKAWKETWAKALWHAAYNGSGPIVTKLLLVEWRKLYSTEYYVTMNSTQPLHAAVCRGHESVVEAFCDSKLKFNCHVEDEHSSRYTPLELATVHLKDKPDIKKRIQSILLETSAVDRGVQESQAQRELTVGSANTIVVGAALIAGVTYAGWLQPPLGYHPYYQFTESVPDAPEAPLSYMFVQGHATIRVFAISNALSFFFAIAAVVAGMETSCFIGELEQMYMTKKNLRNKLKRTRALFILSVLTVLIAFSSAAIAVLPPIQRYQTDMYVTIAVGGFFCMAMMFLFTLSKRRLFYDAKSYVGCMFTRHFKTLTAFIPRPFVPRPFLEGLKKIIYYLEECG